MSELQDLSALIRANTPLIVIETQDEGRIVDLFRQTLMHVWRALHRWSITEGLRRIDLDSEDPPVGPPDASAALQMIRQAEQRGVYLLLDFHPYLGYASHQRALRSEEHTSELQSQSNLVCRLLLEKKKKRTNRMITIVTDHRSYTY